MKKEDSTVQMAQVHWGQLRNTVLVRGWPMAVVWDLQKHVICSTFCSRLFHIRELPVLSFGFTYRGVTFRNSVSKLRFSVWPISHVFIFVHLFICKTSQVIQLFNTVHFCAFVQSFYSSQFYGSGLFLPDGSEVVSTPPPPSSPPVSLCLSVNAAQSLEKLAQSLL